MMKFFLAGLLLSLCSQVGGINWTKDQLEIIEKNRFVPLALHEAGFDAYASLFHPDYTNWYMMGDHERLTDRETYLNNVKVWFEAGNYANYSKVVPISIEIFGELAYVRHLQEEHFVHPDGRKSKFVGHFASLMKRHEGEWTFYRTSFQERYRGPIDGSDISLDAY